MAVRADLINKALRKMGLLRANATTTAFRNTDLGEAYDEVYARLEEMSAIPFASNGTIPDKLIEPVVTLMCFSRMADYTLAPSRSRKIAADAGPQGITAENEFKRLIVGPHTPTVTTFTDY